MPNAKVSVNLPGHAQLLEAVVSSKSYQNRMRQRLEQVLLPRAEQVASQHYQHIAQEISGLLHTGVEGAASARPTVSVRLLGGSVERVPLEPAWRPLTERTLARKRTAKRAVGKDKFWLDRGQLRRAFARAAARDFRVRARIAGFRSVNGRIAFNVGLELSKLPRKYLDDAIRRAVVEALSGEGQFSGWWDLAGAPSTNRATGLMRGYGPESTRPLMRPISRRLGRAMRDDILKSFKRRR